MHRRENPDLARILTICTILTGLSTSLLAAVPKPPRQLAFDDHPYVLELFVGGHDNYICYRIPAMVVTPKGTILAFCEARKNGCPDSGDIDLALKRSSDLGLTWSPMTIIQEDGGDEPITIGNPCPIVDPTTGFIHLVFTRDNKRAFYTCSKNDGLTWTMPREISDVCHQTDYEWQRIGTGPGHGLYSREGWLLVPTWHNLINPQTGDKDYRTGLLISRDQGVTWTISNTIPVKGSNEAMIVEADDGRWRMNMRVQGQKMRTLAWTSDRGQTWETVPAPELVGPTCQASTLHVPLSGGKRALLFSNPASSTRDHLTVRLSEDDGQTWPYARCLEEGKSAYSDLTLLPDGTIAILYEAGRDYYSDRLVFVRFSLKWLRSSQSNAATAPQ